MTINVGLGHVLTRSRTLTTNSCLDSNSGKEKWIIGHEFSDFYMDDNNDDCTVFENHRKKSRSILRAKRATFTFRVGKSSLKMPKIVNFDEFLKI